MTNHEFDWDRIQNLDNKSFFIKRIVSEIIYVLKKNNNRKWNRQSNTELLNVYLSVFNLLFPNNYFFCLFYKNLFSFYLYFIPFLFLYM